MKNRLFIVVWAVLLLTGSAMVQAHAEEANVAEMGDQLWEVVYQNRPVYDQAPRVNQSIEDMGQGEWVDDSETRDEYAQQFESEYWDKDVRKQSISGIQGHQKIEEAYNEYKSIAAPSASTPAASQDDSPKVLTDSDVILSVMDPAAQNRKIDLDFNETALGDILFTLAEAAQMNIVLDPNLKNNRLDLHLKQVTVQQALILIAKSYGLGFYPVGNSLYVTLKDNLRGQSVMSKLVKLQNINVEEAQLLVDGLVQKSSASKDINSLILIGEPDEIVESEKVVELIDKPQPQVVLQAKIIEVNKDALKELGVDWSDSLIVSFQESKRPIDFDNIETSTADKLYNVASFERNPLQFSTAIKMLENQNKAKILSNPRVTTLNDKEAEIFVGDRIPYTVTNVTGGVATTDVRWVEPGIRLSITPSIIGDDFVIIKVKPEVSFIFAFRGPNDEFPHVKTREALAYVRVKNNQPFILGGLLNQEDKKNIYKVPVIGNLPLLGNLFSYEKHTVLDTELIITIIPTIVNAD